MSKFTAKQLKFIENKAAGLPTGQAALLAGFAPSSVSVTGSKLLKRSDIRAAVNNARDSQIDGGAKPRNQGLKAKYETPMEFLIDVMNDSSALFSTRFEAAKALLPYQHARCGGVGKKESAIEKANKVARASKFRPLKPPSLN